MTADIRNGYDFARAIIVATERGGRNAIARLPGVVDIVEHADEDTGAHVVMVHLSNGERLLVTVATLPLDKGAHQ